MEDTIKLPLDADGVPIRPGDVVYERDCHEPHEVLRMEYSGFKGGTWFIVINEKSGILYGGNHYSHERTDNLETIEASIRELIELNEEDALSVIPDLMERIKRMVEK